MRKAAPIAAIVIILIVSALFGLSYLLSAFIGFPSSLGVPIAARIIGVAFVLVGLAMIAWVFRHRSPVNVIVSTYITLTKLFRRTRLPDKAGRTEPLVVSGPQRYVRNPLYLGVMVMVLGWSLLSAYTFVFIATVVLLLWFRLFLIPFEERELNILFGDQWRRYADETPMLLPFTNRKRRR